MKSAIYARQSIDKPDSLSIEGQIDLCRHECRFDEVEVYQDAGYSGKNTKRPALEKLMRDVENGAIGQLVCYRLDRISRNIVDFGKIWEILSARNVEFNSVSERFDTSTSIGRAMLYIIMIFAQMEREAIAERVKDNYYQRVKKGAWPGGPAPYGFEITRRNGQAILVQNDDINIAKLVFDLYSAPDASLGRVAHELTQRGLPCAKRTAWDSISVCRILRNPVYASCNVDVRRYYADRGCIIYNDLDAFDGSRSAIIVGRRTANERKYTDVSEHLLSLTTQPGVIPADVFLAVQYRLDGNRQLKNTGSGKYTWLSGYLKCGVCGYAINVHMDNDYNVLRLTCSGRTRFSNVVCSHRHSEKMPDIEAYMDNAIQEYINLICAKKDVPPEDTSAIDALRLEREKIEARISALINALTDANPVTTRYVNQEIVKLDTRLREIIEELSASASRPNLDALRSVKFNTLSFDEKKSFCKLVLKAVLVTTDDIVPVWL